MFHKTSCVYSSSAADVITYWATTSLPVVVARRRRCGSSIHRQKKTATMADISLYLTNVNVSIGQNMVNHIQPHFAVTVLFTAALGAPGSTLSLVIFVIWLNIILEKSQVFFSHTAAALENSLLSVCSDSGTKPSEGLWECGAGRAGQERGAAA